MPIYYVIYTYEQCPGTAYYVAHIIKSIECNIEDIDIMYKREYLPLINTYRTVQTMIFYREPDNPFRYLADNTTF